MRIKGITLLDAIAAAKRREGEQRYQAIVALLSSQVRRVFEGEIYDTGWYPLDAFVAFLEAGLWYTGDSPTVMTRRAEALIERQLTGIYRVFIKPTDPEYIVRRVVTIHRTYFSGTRVEATTAPNFASIRYRGFQEQHWLLDHTLPGFYRKALEMCGAQNILAQMSVPISEGRSQAVLQVSWRPPQSIRRSLLPNP